MANTYFSYLLGNALGNFFHIGSEEVIPTATGVKITTVFTKFSVPQEGLFPTITIIKIPEKITVINLESMIEIGDGFYYYEFSDYVNRGEYVITCDGGASLPIEERYTRTEWETSSLLKSDGRIC